MSSGTFHLLASLDLPRPMNRFRSSRLLLLPAAALALVAAGCGGDDESSAALPANTADAVSTYARIVFASYQDSLSAAEALAGSNAAFVAAPSEATQAAAQDAWRESRVPYLQTEVYRFYGGPIDDEDGPEGLLNAWPLDENHIDYVMDGQMVVVDGIVNDPSIEITPENLVARNETPNEKDIATGYHAIEFLLWGQDFNADGPGQRPPTDYLRDGMGTAENQERRGEYLTTASELLVSHLRELVNAWDPSQSDNYREEFLALPPEQALSNIMSGMVILSGFETGGERLEAALLAQDQEEEHSCFSDNTHVDMIEDVRGVQNVWLGRYTRTGGTPITGPGVQDVIAARDPDLAERITAKIAESLSLAEALVPPFDREIAAGNAAGNARVDALSVSLFEQTELLEEAFALYNLTRIPDPE